VFGSAQSLRKVFIFILRLAYVQSIHSANDIFFICQN